MSEMLALLEWVQTLIRNESDGGNLDLAVALLRLEKAVADVKAQVEGEADAHVEWQAALHTAVTA